MNTKQREFTRREKRWLKRMVKEMQKDEGTGHYGAENVFVVELAEDYWVKVVYLEVDAEDVKNMDVGLEGYNLNSLYSPTGRVFALPARIIPIAPGRCAIIQRIGRDV